MPVGHRHRGINRSDLTWRDGERRPKALSVIREGRATRVADLWLVSGGPWKAAQTGCGGCAGCRQPTAHPSRLPTGVGAGPGNHPGTMRLPPAVILKTVVPERETPVKAVTPFDTVIRPPLVNVSALAKSSVTSLWLGL